ncbi:hypothetical protein ACH5RR_021076 [Cinchona calisaya]|uniref:Uncharacterized protein n=1 Tax=Cinchona calisaya TaxID=153742 RepID=A0ABD2ZG99_9GENT
MAPSSQSPPCTYKSRWRRSSKAQLSLQKILHIILTVPVPNQPSSSKEEEDPPPISPPATASADKGPASNVEVVNNKDEINYNKGVLEEEDCMGLLADAAKLILGEIKEDEKQRFDDFNDDLSGKQRVKINKRRNKRWPEPEVRSKRGRTRVLPCKYRDSVLEPLTRVSRNRSTKISNNRRLLR